MDDRPGSSGTFPALVAKSAAFACSAVPALAASRPSERTRGSDQLVRDPAGDLIDLLLVVLGQEMIVPTLATAVPAIAITSAAIATAIEGEGGLIRLTGPAYGTRWTSNRLVPSSCSGRPAVIAIRSPELAMPWLPASAAQSSSSAADVVLVVAVHRGDAEEEVQPAHGLDPR